MSKVITRLKTALLVLAILVSALPVTALAKEATSYDVSTAQELKDAVTAVNAGDPGEYTINITADIDMSKGSVTFNSANKTVTIVSADGEHTISAMTRINVSAGPLTVNLGGNGNNLIITGIKDSDDPGMVYINKSEAVFNMYDGATLKDHQGNNYHGGGVTMDGGTFNMYGGTIENCGINGGSNCFGGGVSVNNGALFNMSGGTIKDCYATTSYTGSNPGLIPSGAGGGVIVLRGSTFNMTGGTITGCRASESGGGVATVASLESRSAHGNKNGYYDSKLNIDGGTIENNSAGILGGGIFVSGYWVICQSIGKNPYAPGTPSDPGVTIKSGTIAGNSAESGGGILEIMLNNSIPNTISDGVLLCNNIASYDGSDLYLSNCEMHAPDASKMGSVNYLNSEPSDATDKPIGAWYEDYNPNDDGTRYIDLDPADREDALIADVSHLVADGTGDVALIAAPANSNVVTFVMNGHGTQVPEQTVKNNDKAVKPDNPTESGWTFDGWYADEDCTKEFSFDTPITADTTVYAKWTEITYTLTTSVSGGHGTISDGKANIPENTVETVTFTADEGYEIDKVTVNGTEEKVSSNTLDVTMDTDKSVVVTYKAIPYTVTFDMNGHGTQVPAQTVNYGSKATQPTSPSEDGWTFGGWYTDADCTEVFSFDTSIKADTTIYAKWTEITYALTTSVSGGHGTISDGKESTKMNSVETVTFTPDAGYEIDKVTVNGEEVKVDSTALDVTMDADKTVVVTYKAITHTVTFDMNGHGAQVSAQTVNEGSKATQPTEPTEDGYTFDGWYADKDCTTEYDFDAAIMSDTTIYAKWTEITYTLTTSVSGGNGSISDGKDNVKLNSVETVTFTPNEGYEIDKVTVNGEEVTVKDNTLSVTMDADKAVVVTYKESPAPIDPDPTPVKPEPKPHTVTFVMNGHGKDVPDQTVATGDKATEPTNPSAGKWTFAGWYLDAEYTIAYDFDSPIDSDITLYAKWVYTPGTDQPSNDDKTNPDDHDNQENDKDTNPSNPDAPKTGDNSHMALWITLLTTSCAGFAGFVMFNNKKKEHHDQ